MGSLSLATKRVLTNSLGGLFRKVSFYSYKMGIIQLVRMNKYILKAPCGVIEQELKKSYLNMNHLLWHQTDSYLLNRVLLGRSSSSLHHEDDP